MNPDIILETQRLRLRCFTQADQSFIFTLVNSSGWIQFIGDRKIQTLHDAASYIDTLIDAYETHGFGLWCVESKHTNKAIGMCGLVKRNYLDDVDIGFAMSPEHAGVGLGFEAASATLEHANKNLGFNTVVAITDENNQASIGLLKKIGLNFDRMIRAPEDSKPLLLFSQDALPQTGANEHQQALIDAVNRTMPFGKYAGEKLINLPEPYLVWFHKEGFPNGKLGQQMGLMYEIKLNGLEGMLKPLVNAQSSTSKPVKKGRLRS
tara:strand:+ start:3410 stop:4201 length:792 start_codon:yes stop_codon:yes gene_type:complete